MPRFSPLIRHLFQRKLAAAQTRHFASVPMWYRPLIEAQGDKGTTTVRIPKSNRTYIIDEPPEMGGKDSGPDPLSTFLGALVGCNQATLHAVAKQNHAPIWAVRWQAEGKIDMRGIRGEEGATSRFQSISLTAVVDTALTQEELDRLAALVPPSTCLLCLP
eukprot:jgi/Botrbrau1/3274/Bobra.174_1s0042.1